MRKTLMLSLSLSLADRRIFLSVGFSMVIPLQILVFSTTLRLPWVLITENKNRSNINIERLYCWKQSKYWFKFRSTTMFTISEPKCSIIIKVILVVNRIYKVPYDMYETIDHQWKHRKIEQIKGTRSIFWHSVVPRVKPDDLYMLGSGLGLG